MGTGRDAEKLDFKVIVTSNEKVIIKTKTMLDMFFCFKL